MITELGVFEPTGHGFKIIELAPTVTREAAEAATGAPLTSHRGMAHDDEGVATERTIAEPVAGSRASLRNLQLIGERYELGEVFGQGDHASAAFAEYREMLKRTKLAP